ncbi:MAG TPA: hypothetical protein VNM92_14115 [Thermoanaerobaculia bacterium]|nr:hypothetical protein [Thermoanaerobaculia bacterium]
MTASQTNTIFAAAAVIAIAVSSFACQRADNSRSTTMSPIPGTPGPPSAASQTIGRTPIVTTSGSPSPWKNDRIEFEPVVLYDHSISVRKLIPAIPTVFRVTNRGTTPHQLIIEGKRMRASLPAPLQPGQTMILQTRLDEDRYTFRYAEAGNAEQVNVSTYRPNQ